MPQGMAGGRKQSREGEVVESTVAWAAPWMWATMQVLAGAGGAGRRLDRLSSRAQAPEHRLTPPALTLSLVSVQVHVHTPTLNRRDDLHPQWTSYL